MFRMLEFFVVALIAGVFSYTVYKIMGSLNSYSSQSPVAKAKNVSEINAEITSLKFELEKAKKHLSEGISDSKDQIELFEAQLKEAEELKKKLS